MNDANQIEQLKAERLRLFQATAAFKLRAADEHRDLTPEELSECERTMTEVVSLSARIEAAEQSDPDVYRIPFALTALDDETLQSLEAFCAADGHTPGPLWPALYDILRAETRRRIHNRTADALSEPSTVYLMTAGWTDGGVASALQEVIPEFPITGAGEFFVKLRRHIMKVACARLRRNSK